ncbi:MAG: recombination-associated protein RdgC [Pseudomonadales bacterium]|nr:recombination-associated protein RdgC [Pseudomonadales bacterium]
MWFKNLSVYRLTKPWILSAEALDKALQHKPFVATTAQEPQSLGWVAPLGKDSELLYHQANGNIMLCLKKEQKILPASVINDALAAKVAELEDAGDHKLTRKEKQRLKDEIRFDLLPRAFAKSSLLYAYIAVEQGLIVVNSGSQSAAEELLSLLRDCVGSLALIPLTAKQLISASMTTWLQQADAVSQFELGADCELKDHQHGGSIKCKQQDLLSDDILQLLASGMQVTQLALNWQDKLEFMLDENFIIKRLKYSELIDDQLQQTDVQTAAEQFDVDFCLMAQELHSMLSDLVSALGGEAESSSVQQERLDAARAGR